MDHLSPEQRQNLAGLLDQRRQALRMRLQAHQRGLSRVEYASELLAQDADDAPQRAAERELDMALSDHELLELASIDQALQRIAEGQFGQCADCGCPIPLARLQLEPATLRCVPCQSRHEKEIPT